MITMREVKSSNIHSIGYDEDARRLVVCFKGPDKVGPGKQYAYRDVSPEVFDAFESAKSVGKFFHAEIRGKYETETIAA